MCNLGETDCIRYLGDENNCLEKSLPGEKKGSNEAKLAGGLAAFPEVNSRGRGKEREINLLLIGTYSIKYQFLACGC